MPNRVIVERTSEKNATSFDAPAESYTMFYMNKNDTGKDIVDVVLVRAAMLELKPCDRLG